MTSEVVPFLNLTLVVLFVTLDLLVAAVKMFFFKGGTVSNS